MSLPDEPRISIKDALSIGSASRAPIDPYKDRDIRDGRAREGSLIELSPTYVENKSTLGGEQHLQSTKQTNEERLQEHKRKIHNDSIDANQEKGAMSKMNDMHLIEESLETNRTIESGALSAVGHSDMQPASTQVPQDLQSEPQESKNAFPQETIPGTQSDMASKSESASSHINHVPDLILSSDADQVTKENIIEINAVDAVEKSDDDSHSEIQSILEQFDEQADLVDEEVISSQRTILLSNSTSHPPRKSSLEPTITTNSSFIIDQIDQSKTNPPSYLNDLAELQRSDSSPHKPSKTSSLRSLSIAQPGRLGSIDNNAPGSPMSSVSLQKSLPPVPDPEPDLPFDFHRFLEQLRHRTADPVAKFLRSFLIEFGKKQWMVHEQVKIVSDFLTFITSKMAQCEVWRDISDAEFDNAKEGMEKLVMNRLYSQTFSPAIPAPIHIPTVKEKRKTVEKPLVPGRRGQHQEDIERDEVLAQKVRIYGWITEEHLDISPVGDNGRRFLTLAQQELLKIKSYRAPRDKVICVLNCCKVIFGLLRNSKSADTSADSFVPLLIYVVLQANPEHLVSNVQYILRFRNQDRLGGEAGYYLSSLMGAIQFIENLDRTVLTVSDKEFERNVEAAVSAIAERIKEDDPQVPELAQVSEKSKSSKPDLTHRTSMDGETSHRAWPSSRVGPLDGVDDKAAVSGLLRTIQRPLSSIGRIFSEENTSPHPSDGLRVQEVPAHPPETPRRLSPAVFQPPRNSNDTRRSADEPRSRTPRLSAQDAAARQASAEAAEAHRIQQAEHKDVVTTLASMFPDLDRDIIDDVVRMKEGRVGLAVEACLALNS